MRILVIHSNYGRFGGGEVFVQSFIDLLQKNGHDVFLFAFTNGPEISTATELVLKDPFYEKNQNPAVFFLRYVLRFFFDPHVAFRLRDWIGKIRPDIIHLHANDRYGNSVLFALIGLRIPVVQTIHAYTILCMSETSKLPSGQNCSYYHGFRCLMHRCLSLWKFLALVPSYGIKWWMTKRIVDRLIAPNPRIQERLINCGFQKTVLIEHFGKEPNRIPSVENVAWGSMLCVGRLSREKGFQYVIRAMEYIIEDVPGAVLHMCGDGPYEDELKELVNELHLSESVIFHGYVNPSDLEDFYERANVIVFPSICLEVSPLVTLEALSHGRPLIISDLCGIRELFEGKNIGFFVDPTDTKELAKYTLKILKNKDLFLEMSRAAYSLYTERFSPRIHYYRIVSFYQSLLVLKKESHQT